MRLRIFSVRQSIALTKASSRCEFFTMENDSSPFQGHSYANRQAPDQRLVEVLTGIGSRHDFDAATGLFMVEHEFKNGAV